MKTIMDSYNAKKGAFKGDFNVKVQTSDSCPLSLTNWVRVQVDTDSIRTINASTFGEIGTYSSHIWTMLWS